MISQDNIEEFSRKYQTSNENVRREYLQHLFLSVFYRQKSMDQAYFKGGTALRLIYKSPRFSEDLDFDSSLANIVPIEQAVLETLVEINRGGIKTDVQESKKTTGGYLAVVSFSAGGEVTLIRIEVSFRDRSKKGESATISSDLFPEYSIMQIVEKQLVEGKIAALLDRKKPRDFYDFYFLLRHDMIPASLRVEMLPKVLDTLKNTNISFQEDLGKFLPKSHNMVLREFPAPLEREIKRYTQH